MCKVLVSIIILLSAFSLKAQVKVGSEGNIIATGSYPVAKSSAVKGTLHFFQTITDRNNLPANFRDTGMLAYVYDSLKYYSLKNGIDNSDWVEFQGSSGGNYDSAYNNLVQAADSSYLGIKDFAGRVDTIEVYGGTGGSGGVTAEQVSDSLGKITLQRAYNNAPTAVPQISNSSGFPFNIRSGSLSGTRGDLLLTGGGAELNSVYGTYSAKISNGIIGDRIDATSGVPAIVLDALRSGDDTLPSSYTFLNVTPDFVHIQNILSPTKVIIQNADTLSTPPAYIWADDNDTLKKVAYPGGGSTTFEQSLQNQGETAFTTDNTVDLGGREFHLENASFGSFKTFQAGLNVLEFQTSTDTSTSGVFMGADSVRGFLDDPSTHNAVQIVSSFNDSSQQIYVEPHKITFSSGTGSEEGEEQGNIMVFENLDSSNANPNNIAWFDENNILHRGYLAPRLKSYTVATLPVSPTQGDEAAVTDATSPAYLEEVTGGGSTYAPVVFNGTIWVCH